MGTIQTSEQIDQDRRRFVGVAATAVAAAGSLSLFPESLVAATESDAIRPFRVNVPRPISSTSVGA
jgi:hypothetical protein